LAQCNTVASLDDSTGHYQVNRKYKTITMQNTPYPRHTQTLHAAIHFSS